MMSVSVFNVLALLAVVALFGIEGTEADTLEILNQKQDKHFRQAVTDVSITATVSGHKMPHSTKHKRSAKSSDFIINNLKIQYGYEQNILKQYKLSKSLNADSDINSLQVFLGNLSPGMTKLMSKAATTKSHQKNPDVVQPRISRAKLRQQHYVDQLTKSINRTYSKSSSTLHKPQYKHRRLHMFMKHHGQLSQSAKSVN